MTAIAPNLWLPVLHLLLLAAQHNTPFMLESVKSLNPSGLALAAGLTSPFSEIMACHLWFVLSFKPTDDYSVLPGCCRDNKTLSSCSLSRGAWPPLVAGRYLREQFKELLN